MPNYHARNLHLKDSSAPVFSANPVDLLEILDNFWNQNQPKQKTAFLFFYLPKFYNGQFGVEISESSICTNRACSPEHSKDCARAKARRYISTPSSDLVASASESRTYRSSITSILGRITSILLGKFCGNSASVSKSNT